MPTAIHSFSQEEMMAYLDGELAPERASAAAQHLEQCRECQRLAADFQTVAQRLADWEIASITAEPPRQIGETHEQPKQLFWKRPGVLIGATALFLIVLFPFLMNRPHEALQRSVIEPEPAHQRIEAQMNRQSFIANPTETQSRAQSNRMDLVRSSDTQATPPLQGPSSGPLIVRTAQVSMMSENFERSRADLEQIVSGHQGYTAQMALNASNGASRSLIAMIRVPAQQLDATLRELKRLGRVVEESQRGEDVTQRYVDIDARLSNLRTTENRLLAILKERTGKLADVLQVEEAVDRTRGDIETAEAEKKLLSEQIALATVNVTISETYKAPFERNDSSTLTRLRNAAVVGYRNVVDFAVGAVELFLAVGPILLVLVAIAFFPGRWFWRRWRDGRLPNLFH